MRDRWCLILRVDVHVSVCKVNAIQIILLPRVAVGSLCSTGSHSYLILFLIVQALNCVLFTWEKISELIAILIFLMNSDSQNSEKSFILPSRTQKLPVGATSVQKSTNTLYLLTHTQYKLVAFIFFIKKHNIVYLNSS